MWNTLQKLAWIYFYVKYCSKAVLGLFPCEIQLGTVLNLFPCEIQFRSCPGSISMWNTLQKLSGSVSMGNTLQKLSWIYVHGKYSSEGIPGLFPHEIQFRRCPRSISMWDTVQKLSWICFHVTYSSETVLELFPWEIGSKAILGLFLREIKFNSCPRPFLKTQFRSYPGLIFKGKTQFRRCPWPFSKVDYSFRSCSGLFRRYITIRENFLTYFEPRVFNFNYNVHLVFTLLARCVSACD